MKTVTAPSIEFSVRVIEGGKVKFDSSITHPLFLADDKHKEAVENWMQRMAAGLRLGRMVAEDTAAQDDA